MFLNIKKIGKAKHKYKAKVYFVNLVNEGTERGIFFKVIIQRGSHQITAVSQPSRKGVAKFKNTQYVIPMTLFYDEDDKQSKYLQKQATIKAYQSDQQGKQIRKIGTKDIDLSEYPNKGKLRLQIQLQPTKRTDSPILTIQILLQRQDDDSKSVQTYSSNNDAKSKKQAQPQPQPQQINERPRKKVHKKSEIVSQGTPNKVKLGQRQKKQKSENDFNDSKDRSPIKPKRYQQQRRKGSEGFSKQQKSQDSTRVRPNVRINAPTNSQVSRQGQTGRQAKRQQQIRSKLPASKIEQILQQSPESKNNGSNLHTEFTQGQSPELQVFLLKKALREKQSQIGTLKRQNEILKKSIDKVIEQSSLSNQKMKTPISSQIDQYKKALTSKDIQIDNLTTTNKSLKAREEQYEKTILKLRQQLLANRQKMTDIKYRQAFFMQELFQMGNKDALEQASRYLSI